MLDYGFDSPLADGSSLSSSAPSPRPAADMRNWKCGKSYPGFSIALKATAGTVEIATPDPRPAASLPQPTSKPTRTIRRF
jgi:hypothetical protein